MKTIDHKWINAASSCVGVVLAEDEYSQCAYLSPVRGLKENADIEDVKSLGYKLLLNEAIGFFGDKVDPEKYKR